MMFRYFVVLAAVVVITDVTPALAQQNCEAIRQRMTTYAQQAHLATAADIAHLRSLEAQYNRCTSGGDGSTGARKGSSTSAGSPSSGSAPTSAGAATVSGAIAGGVSTRSSGGVPTGIGIGMGAVLGTILGDVLSSGPPEEPKLKHSRRASSSGFAGCVSRCKSTTWHGNPPADAVDKECRRSCGHDAKNF